MEVYIINRGGEGGGALPENGEVEKFGSLDVAAAFAVRSSSATVQYIL